MRRWRVAFGLGVALAGAVGVAVVAQPSGSNQVGGPSASAPPAADSGPPGVPIIEPPPVATPPPPSHVTHASNATESDDSEDKAPSNSLAKHAAAPPPLPPPPAAPKPLRSPAAILQALDKVTAETLRFAAPVGQPVRYKNLVFTVKACESTGLGGPSPEASAFVVIDSAPLGAQGIAPPPARQVYKGWMFANSPGLNPFQHPVYDAWLIACMAPAPAPAAAPPAKPARGA
jgi:hypothetical protein